MLSSPACGWETSRWGAREAGSEMEMCVQAAWQGVLSGPAAVAGGGEQEGLRGQLSWDRVLTKTSTDPSGHSGVRVVHSGVRGLGFVPPC